MIEVRRSDDFQAWFCGLRDRKARAVIVDRVSRLERGLTGDIKSVGDGVGELRIHYGPGYRVYLARQGDALVVLLCGGDKGSQDRDVKRAKALAKEL